MKKVIFIGVGASAGYCAPLLRGCEVLAVVNPYDDNNEQLPNSFLSFAAFKNAKAKKLKQAVNMDFDLAILACGNVRQVKEKLLDFGVPKEKITAFIVDNNLNDGISARLQNVIDKECDEFFNFKSEIWSQNTEQINIKKPRFYPCIQWYSQDIGSCVDYVREKTLFLHAEKMKNIEGACAECGVYKGDFAMRINTAMPERKLYLFDTFGGFDSRDFESEKNKALSNNGTNLNNRFSDTSEKVVLERMPYKEQIVIKKGYFPQTFDLSDEKFVFVSLDMDLYAPILSALEIFYKQMVKGGMIMVHDYKNPNYGAACAVDEFAKANNISFMVLPDAWGSAVFIK